MPYDRQPIGCKWIFKRKLNPDGSVARYKARLVAKGFSQKFGVDYDETYAPVAKLTSIRTLLSIGASCDLLIHQMDVKTAFLNGNLNEEIYMTVPEGIDAATSSNSVCKLNRTLYGLKQSPRMWNQKIDNFLLHEQGFTRLNSDHGTYIRRSNQSLAIIALYVDDLLILTDSLETMTTLKLNLSQTFAMTDCGEIHHFLGIKITRDRNKRTITLDQGHYIDQILTRFNMTNCKPVATPLDASIQLKITEDAEITDVTLYQQIVGSAMYLMIATRPDIAATISIISQFTSKPTRDHHHAAKHLLHYLKGTRNYKLHLGCQDDSDLSLIGYSDANWGGDVNT